MATDKKTGFFTLKDIFSKHADVNMIISGRSNGKTFSSLKYVLEQYKKHKKKFVYIRRWKDDIKLSKANKLFLPLKDVVRDLFGEGWEIIYYNNEYFLVDPDEKKHSIGYIVALSESHHLKSVSFVDIGTIIYDEFIQMAGERLLMDELSRWENLLSTIIRFRTDIKVIMLANTVSKFATYFSYYKIPINNMKIGDIFEVEFETEGGTLKVACEYAEVSTKISEKTSKYILKSNMITTGEWEIPPVDEIITAPGERATEKLLFSVWDPEANTTLGVYFRRAVWYNLEKQGLILKNVKHVREFFVIRNKPKTSSYFHLTDIKDLKYNTYTDWDRMMQDIKDRTGFDFKRELSMNRVYCDNMFTADFFNHAYSYYNQMRLRDVL